MVDTNVIAYFVLGTPDFADEVGRFWASSGELLAPALWEAEFANVLWLSMRGGVLPAESVLDRLSMATRLGIHSVAVRTLWHGAVVRSLESNVAVYDTLFVELAEREQVPLVTFDKKILAAYPEIARRPS